MKIGMIFAGQGSQYVGMGKAFYDERNIVDYRCDLRRSLKCSKYVCEALRRCNFF